MKAAGNYVAQTWMFGATASLILCTFMVLRNVHAYGFLAVAPSILLTTAIERVIATWRSSPLGSLALVIVIAGAIYWYALPGFLELLQRYGSSWTEDAADLDSSGAPSSTLLLAIGIWLQHG